ncbi:MAG TPA: hypothetical protein VGG71_10890, partial [Chitinophagaceae bacterium]
MHFQKIIIPRLLVFSFLLLIFDFSQAQMITGVWVGKVNRQKVEIKMVQNGDSLRGTAYYFESATRYRRYSIKGYLDESDNSVVWWDDQLLEDKMKGLDLFSKNKKGSSRADFNCPGGGVMKLDGNVYHNEDETPDGEVHLTKVETVSFKDEWDFVIENYIAGANDPDIIDSISQIAQKPVNEKNPETTAEDKTVIAPLTKKDVPIENDPVKKEIVTVPLATPENKTSFEERKITPPSIEQK